MPDRPLREEPFPDIQSKHPLAQLHTISRAFMYLDALPISAYSPFSIFTCMALHLLHLGSGNAVHAFTDCTGK